MKPLHNINTKKYINLHIHMCPYTFQKENTGSFQTPMGYFKIWLLTQYAWKVIKRKYIFSNLNTIQAEYFKNLRKFKINL